MSLGEISWFTLKFHSSKKEESKSNTLTHERSVAYRDQRRKARELADQNRKQHFYDSLRKNKKIKALLSSKSKKAPYSMENLKVAQA